jgi:hypothetical protein
MEVRVIAMMLTVTDRPLHNNVSASVQLKKKFPHLKFVSLPKKHLLGNMGSEIVSSRRVMLENFLEDLLMKPEVRASSELIIFLQPSDNYSQVVDLKRTLASDAQAIESIKNTAGSVAVSAISADSFGAANEVHDSTDDATSALYQSDPWAGSKPISMGENLSIMLGPNKKQYVLGMIERTLPCSGLAVLINTSLHCCIVDERQRARNARRQELAEQEAERRRITNKQMVDQHASLTSDIERIRRDIADAQAEIAAEIQASKASLFEPATSTLPSSSASTAYSASTLSGKSSSKVQIRTSVRFNIEILRVSQLPPLDGQLKVQWKCGKKLTNSGTTPVVCLLHNDTYHVLEF